LMGLRCRACHLLQPADERYVCADCYGAIEPEYDTASFDTDGLRGAIEHGPRSLWRYAPLLPIAAPESHFAVGWTPLIKAPRLGAAIGVSELYVKDDSRNPSLSFKDRPVALALARALELGLDTIACASTGNLAGAVAAAAARNGLRAFVFVPAGTDESKVAGAAAYGATAAAQLPATGLVDDERFAIHAAQPSGCAPVSDAVLERYREVRPVREPTTIARSLAIGTPADGDGSVAAIRQSGGSAASVSDEDVVEGCALLARTEGVLGEPAAGVVVATARALAARGAFREGDRVVLYVTG